MLALGALFGIRSVQIAMRWPTRIVVADEGALFVATTHTRFVPWSDLQSVRVSRGRWGGAIRWTLAQSPHITTAGTFAKLHHLLVDVEQHAPHARVEA